MIFNERFFELVEFKPDLGSLELGWEFNNIIYTDNYMDIYIE